MTNQEMVALTALSRELFALTGKQGPGHRKLWQLTVDGRLPAEQVNGRHYVRRADLLAIASTLGLSAPDDLSTPKASAPTRRRRSASELAEA